MDLKLLFWYSNILGQIVLLLRLAHLRLLSRYRWFVFFLAFSTVRSIALLFQTNLASKLYWTIWAITEPVIILLLAAAVIELYRHVTEAYPGIGELGGRILNVSLGIGGIATVLLAFIDARGYAPFLFLLKRCVTSILAVFLICVAWSLMSIKITIPRNTIVHARIMTVFCSIIAVGYFGLDLGLNRPAVSTLFLAVCCLCFLLWTILLRADGESVTLPPPLSDEEEARSRKKLDDLLRVISKRPPQD